MREKVVDIADVIPERTTPYSVEVMELANKITASLTESLDAGDIGDIEAAGRQALAALLSLYAAGKLPDKQAFSFLKSLAERKTPDPVQKVEQTTQVDMRMMVGGLITDNLDALKEAVNYAKEARVSIASRLRSDSLQLSAAAVDDDGEPIVLEEPSEIRNIREGRQPTKDGIDWAFYRTLE